MGQKLARKESDGDSKEDEDCGDGGAVALRIGLREGFELFDMSVQKKIYNL